MSKNEWKKWLGVVGRMLLAYALVFAQGARATPNQATKDKAASPQKAAAQQANEKQTSLATSAKTQSTQARGEESENLVAEEKPSRDGSHEGIKVHGHWTIEVRNPDGSLVTHREFENAYQYTVGALPAILAHQSVGPWSVSVCDTPSCPNGNFLSEGPSLNVSVPSSGGNAGKFVLAGSFTALASLSIAAVATFVTTCKTVAPANCPVIGVDGSRYSFTSATLSAPVSVSNGQIVQFTVAISFS